ncbi:MAG: DUF3810 domain-containing protein [Clostridia bacterium]|nr:DUF3810 domain-containing protein [Clostridia bacterium]
MTHDTVPETNTGNTQTGRRRPLTWRRLALRALWLLLYPAAFLSVSFVRSRPGLVESVYSQGIYPPLSETIGGAFSMFPFSFAEMLVYSIVAFLVWFAASSISRAVRRRLPLRRFLNSLLMILIVGGAGLNAFYWMWGFNYFRVPLRNRLGIVQTERTPEQLESLCLLLAEAANRTRSGLEENNEGIFVFQGGQREALKLIPAAYANLGKILPLFDRRVYRPKPVLASELMSYAGISGIFIPFTEEANVNVADPPLLVGSSAAHETAHFLGIASEDEANFTAYLACLASDSPELEYSGLMLALIHAGNALSRVDRSAYADLWKSYSDAVVRDLDQYNAYLQSHQGEVAETVDKVNDNYLKANGQAAGVASYGQMVDLLLDYYGRAAEP